MRKNILQHIGAIVSGRRNEEHLTQQQLAQQTGRGLRHIQNIEKGRVNASIGMRREYRQKKHGSICAAPASFNRIIKRI